MIEEETPLPDLIVVDGGKGQLSSAYRILCELGIEGQVTLVGLAKRLEEIFFPNESLPYYLDKRGEPLKVICHLRDEAHRFGITHHRNRRSKSLFDSQLDSIAGVGKQSKEALLRHFGSLSKISAASQEEIAKVVGKSRAAKVVEALHK